MLEEAEVVTRRYGDKVESPGGQVDRKDERTTWMPTTESNVVFFSISSLAAHESATMIIRAKDLMTKKDTEYPADSARGVRERT
jgi:hypothetical protein